MSTTQSKDEINGAIDFTIHTERLTLRLADPDSDADCETMLFLHDEFERSSGEPSTQIMKTFADVRRKHEKLGPKAELCTLAPPPRGMNFFVYLRSDSPGTTTTGDSGNEGMNSGPLIGSIGINFRAEVRCPDLAWSLLDQYQGKGYATEAASAALRFWRDVIGVKEIWVGVMEDNVKSIRLAERVGFVQAENFELVLGQPPEVKSARAVALVLPGMEWKKVSIIRLTGV